jgi:hypothetical protein
MTTLSEVTTEMLARAARTYDKHPAVRYSQAQRTAPDPDQRDDADALRLRNHLLISEPQSHSGHILFGLVRGVSAAIGATWAIEERPEIVIVLGASWARIYRGSPLCAAASPLGARLVKDRLADEDELYGENLFNDYLFSGLTILHDPEAARSSIRWINPAGDRTIVVLPPGYDAP